MQGGVFGSNISSSQFSSSTAPAMKMDTGGMQRGIGSKLGPEQSVSGFSMGRGALGLGGGIGGMRDYHVK